MTILRSSTGPISIAYLHAHIYIYICLCMGVYKFPEVRFNHRILERIGDFDGGNWKTVASVPWSVKKDGVGR